jgi:hypothetical protein
VHPLIPPNSKRLSSCYIKNGRTRFRYYQSSSSLSHHATFTLHHTHSFATISIRSTITVVPNSVVTRTMDCSCGPGADGPLLVPSPFPQFDLDSNKNDLNDQYRTDSDSPNTYAGLVKTPLYCYTTSSKSYSSSPATESYRSSTPCSQRPCSTPRHGTSKS